MGIVRLLLLVAAAWLIWRALGAWKRRSAVPVRRAPKLGGPMVRCAHCGLHVPKREAVTRDERSYCCEAHRDAAASGEGR
jgi:uncharacterized protein